MLKKNLDLYREKYKNIDKDTFIRIQKFMASSKFSEKDMKKFSKEVVRITKQIYEGSGRA